MVRRRSVAAQLRDLDAHTLLLVQRRGLLALGQLQREPQAPRLGFQPRALELHLRLFLHAPARVGRFDVGDDLLRFLGGCLARGLGRVQLLAGAAQLGGIARQFLL